MRLVIQRVSHAQVEVAGEVTGKIGNGLLVYLSVAPTDTDDDVQFVADKLANLRLFPDRNDKMNLSIRDVAGSILLISQFTLHGDCRKGRRPSFDQAAQPDTAQKLYHQTIEAIRAHQIPVETGVFAAHMHVSSLNDGPVTFLLDSSRLF